MNESSTLETGKSIAGTSSSRAGMGAILHDQGVAFRVWAPHATAVYVSGSFNQWADASHPMAKEENGYWYLDIADIKAGDEYRYRIVNGDKVLMRIDPYARHVTSSVGNAIVYDTQFDWADDHFKLPPVNEMVIYEMHLGTFNDTENEGVDRFAEVIEKLDHLKRLGINVIELMPLAQFAGHSSWGYNPSCIFAVSTHYGGPDGFKRFVKAVHEAGIGVILDVVYNHFGPSDLDLWQFDGWSEHDKGGIYFYNDWRSETPWGHTRPDYGRGAVRDFIRDNAMMWLEEYHVDGLRYDMSLFIRNVHGSGDPGADLHDGWSLVQWINNQIHERFPGRFLVAEDLQNDDRITLATEHGGLGCTAQWSARFVHPIRAAVITPEDRHRSMDSVRQAIEGRYNGDPFQRVIYSESHDEIANGKARVPSEIDPGDPDSFFAQKRSTLAGGLVMTTPGIPMLFQGQEFLEDGWFQDTVPLDWDKSEEFSGLVRMYRDLIRLRLNHAGFTRGLTGSGLKFFHQNHQDNVFAFHRWYHGGPGDDVVVVANLANKVHHDYLLGFPGPGTWHLRFNSDWKGYSKRFSDHFTGDVIAGTEHQYGAELGPVDSWDGFPDGGKISIGPYTLLIFSEARRD